MPSPANAPGARKSRLRRLALPDLQSSHQTGQDKINPPVGPFIYGPNLFCQATSTPIGYSLICCTEVLLSWVVATSTGEAKPGEWSLAQRAVCPGLR